MHDCLNMKGQTNIIFSPLKNLAPDDFSGDLLCYREIITCETNQFSTLYHLITGTAAALPSVDAVASICFNCPYK